MDFSKENVKKKLKKIARFIFNPRLLLCLGIAWMITNGWCYVFAALGTLLDITWMTVVGVTYAGLLWIPFTPEKILTVIIAIFLLRVIFPNDKNTLAVLKEEFAEAMADIKKLKAKLSKKKNSDKK